MVAKLHHCATSGAMSAAAAAAAGSNKSKCLPQMKANSYFKLLSPILLVIVFFAIIQVLLLTTAESSTNDFEIAKSNKTTTTTAPLLPPTTPAKFPSWLEIWKNGDSFLQSSPEVLSSSRARRSQTLVTTLAPRVLLSSNSSSVNDENPTSTTTKPQNVTESQIKAPDLHVASESDKAIQISTSSLDDPEVDPTVENVAKQAHREEAESDTLGSQKQRELINNDLVYNKLDKGFNHQDTKMPMGVDIGELVPGSFEGLLGADEDLIGGNEDDNNSQAKQIVNSQQQQQQPEASELVEDGHGNHIGPSLETIIHDDKAGDIRAQVGLSLHYQPLHSSISSVHDTDESDGTTLPATGGLAEVTNNDEAIADSNNEQQEDYRAASRRHKPYRSKPIEDIGRVIVGAKRHRGLAQSSRSNQMTRDLNTAAGHYYGKKKKKMVYKKKKIRKKKKKIIIVKKKKKKKMKVMKKKKLKKYKVKKYKKKKIVIIKKKKRKAKKYHHHHGGHHYGHHGGHHGGGGHGKYYMYAKVPKKKSWEFGFKRGNKKHWIERHEKGHKNKFKTKVKWYDAKSKGKGIHIWDYNHHDKKKKKHYG